MPSAVSTREIRFANVTPLPPANRSPTGLRAQSAQFTVSSWRRLFTERTLLVIGVLAYMVAGFAACATYGLNDAETPAVLKTIAVAFGGYVIAFVGSAMRQVSD